MIRRLLVLSLVIGFTSVAQAGVVLEIVPSPSQNAFNPCGVFDPGEVVSMQVMLEQGDLAEADHLIRMVKLDLSASDPALNISSFAWVPGFGAAGHYIDASLVSGPDGVAAVYKSVDPADLGANPAAQVNLPGNGTAIAVASFDVTMPAVGSYSLDILNSAGATNDDKAAVTYGFDCDAAPALCPSPHADNTFPVTIHLAGAGLTGGSTTLQVVNQALATSKPADQTSLWRSQQNIVRLTFGVDLVGAPAAGEVEIRELSANGGFGADLSAGFSFLIENDGGGNPRILRIRDTGANLAHGKWYLIVNQGGWAAVPPFAVQHVLQIGDANNDGLVLALDVGVVNSGIPCFGCPDDDRRDMNGDGLVLALDVGVVNGHIPSFPVARPSGHECQ